jgi:protein-S-isoprenylcysteine O-methyltransferase Ste14
MTKGTDFIFRAVKKESAPLVPSAVCPRLPHSLRRSKGVAMKHLNTKAWLAVATLSVFTALVLFIPAGTLRYWQAWTYLLVFTVSSALMTLYLIHNDPALLERRMRGGPVAEKQPVQRLIMLSLSAAFVGLLVVPALDHRWGWSSLPFGVAIAGDALVAIGFYLITLVYRENTFASATIEVADNQRVISTGPYAIVRHPMYASALLYLLGTPLALGSWWGFVPIVVMMPLLVWRLVDEERYLAMHLPGYTDYRRQVRCRLVPCVW